MKQKIKCKNGKCPRLFVFFLSLFSSISKHHFVFRQNITEVTDGSHANKWLEYRKQIAVHRSGHGVIHH